MDSSPNDHPFIPESDAQPAEAMDTELAELWEKHWAGSKDARNKLVEHYFPLVELTADQVVEVITQAIAERDFHQSAVIGYLEAMDQYPENAEMPFEEFSARKIRATMLEELQNFLSG